ncbi:acyl-CoA dehydrogenase family protein [Lentzea nigeriaca]
MTTTFAPFSNLATAERAGFMLTRAEQLRPLLREHAGANEESGQLTAPVLAALHEQGFFGMWTPADLGGAELDPITSLNVLQSLAEADPSVAWVLMATSLATGTAGGYLADSAVQQVFQGDRFPVIAGQGTRPGRAVRDGDGYRLSGEWSFGSGIKHANWIHTLGVVEGTGEALIFIVPVEKATLIDNWDVMGLRATGSIDYTIDNLFVPAEFTHPATTEAPLRGGSLLRLGIIHLAIIGHSAWALGLSRSMLDELGQLVRGKAGRAGSVADSTNFLATYGKAEAQWHAAHSLVHRAWQDITASLNTGNQPSHQQKTLARLALYNATWTAESISTTVYHAAGTTALRSGSLQRNYRDMHAGTQHITSSPSVIEACGRSLAGLVPDSDWLLMQLVPTADRPTS